MKEQWILKNVHGDQNAIAKQYNIPTLVAKLMINRGISSPDEIERYLYATTEQMYDPYLLCDMDKTVALLKKAKQENALIAISSDYDCDGIFSSYILKEGFQQFGLKSHIFIPHRVDEGYGMNTRIVDEAIELGATYIITCDNGVSAYEAIDYAKEHNITVIVTDHHDIQDRLPNADAIVNPKRSDCTYPFKGLCGAGVAFKVVQALTGEFPTKLLSFAAIATVADVMELVDENRIIVKAGLKQISHTSHVGLLSVIHATNLSGKELSPYHIGFIIGPCFNATGRLSNAEHAISLLDEKDPTKADMLANKLVELNNSRKDLTLDGFNRALAMCETNHTEEDDVMLIYLPDCHESLVGIIAGRIRERYNHPVIVFTDASTDGMIKGSGRSIPAYDMFTELLACSDLFTHFGGHKMAAGLSLPKENLETLRSRLNNHSTLTAKDFSPEVFIDLAMPVSYINKDRIEALDLLAPFGRGNEKPVFAEKHFQIKRAIRRGANKNVLSLTLFANNTRIEGVFFGDIDGFEQFIIDEFGKSELDAMYNSKPNNIDVAFTYYPSINTYNGYDTIQLQVMNYCRINQ